MDPASSSSKRPAIEPPGSPPPHTRQRYDYLLECDDSFSHDQHMEMDKAIIEELGDFQPSTAITGATLLACIVRNSNRLLDHKYEDLFSNKDLLINYPDLLELLQKSWSSQTFRSIRILEILKVQSKPISKFKRTTDFMTYPISDAWKGDYRGNYHEILYANLNRLNVSKPYSNFVSIMQSSGSGKSRMVDQLADLVFTIPFNIRSPDDSRVLAYPPPDAQIYTFLSQTGIMNINLLQGYYVHFMRHVFEEVHIHFTQFFHNSPMAMTYTELALSWHKHLAYADIRNNLYDLVVKKSRSSWNWALDVHHDLKDLENEMLNAFRELSTAIDNCCNADEQQPIKVVMYFDECHSLSSIQPHDDDKTLLDVLFSVVASLSPHPIITIFLSTSSHFSSLIPSKEYARSARGREYWKELQPPFVEIPFDCGPMLPIAQKTLRLKDTCTVEFLAQFGRPLFWTMITHAGNRKDTVLSTTLDLARSKLLCEPYPNEITYYKDAQWMWPAFTAVVDLRLMFDYDLQQEATHAFQEQLVAKHMRTVFSVPQERDYIRSGYPSEPLLAEAAAKQMHAFHLNHPGFTVHVLVTNFKSGLLHKGECRELVARELLTSAYDQAVEREFQNSGHSNDENMLVYSRGVSIITFIEELFTSSIATQVLDSVPNNSNDKIPLRDAFQNAKVRFTHFGKMADETGTTTDAAWTAFIRGMAIIAAVGTRNIDLIIPVLLNDTEICEEAVTAILISVKNRKTKGNVAEYMVDEKAVDFFPPSQSIPSSSRPYIGLVMELGIHESDTGSNIHIQEPPRRPSRHLRTAHPRYSTFLYGCSNAVYKGITPEQRGHYQFLLASTDFLSEHPRQDKDTMSVLCRMKPFWKAGSNFYHWIEDIPDRLSPNE